MNFQCHHPYIESKPRQVAKYSDSPPFIGCTDPGALVGCKQAQRAARCNPQKRNEITSFFKHPSTLYRGLIQRSNEPKLKPVRLPVALLAQER
jgi:hypothetical protein